MILSGTGSDGTLGLDEIKGQDGITFVQDAASAAYGEMPRSAQSSADYVLPPDQIAKELKRIANHPYVSKAPAEAAAESIDEPKQIFHLIQRVRGVDFSRYKPASVRRRIARRMLLKHVESLADYLNQLRTNKEELDALYEDLLITVTEFFRDPGVFDFLKSEIIPGILKTLPQDTPARVWVPGCASGEEAYSIAICFVEASKDRAGPPVQVFATDVSEHSIRKARQAIYQKNIATSVSPERLQRFFVKEAGGYHINKLIRDMCIFAEQNVIADAPFSRMDLVSCRNLLIYLDTSTQKEVLHRFHYALKPTGSLLLGTSESTAAAPQLFEQVHKPERVYAKVHITGRIDFALVGRSPIHGPLAKAPVAVARPVRDIGNEIDQLLLRRFGPSGVLLNSEMEILQFRGSTGGLLEPASGEASLNVFRMIRKELAAPLHVALHEARISYTHKRHLEVPVNGHTMRLDLEVSRLRPEPKGETYYLVLFEVPRTSHRPGTRKKYQHLLRIAGCQSLKRS